MNAAEITTVLKIYTKVFKVQDFKVKKKCNETFLNLQSRALFNYFLIFLTSTEHFKII